MDAMQGWQAEKSAFLISTSTLVTFGLRALLDSAGAGIRISGTAKSYPPDDLLSLSNADLVVIDGGDAGDSAHIAAIAAEIANTFGKPMLLLAAAPELVTLRAVLPGADYQIVDREASRETLLAAFGASLREGLAKEAAHGQDARRREARVAVQIPARLDAEACITRNLSARGMYIELQEDAHAVGDTVLIEIDLHSPEGDSTLSLSGEIVRREQVNGRVGLGVRILSSGEPHKALVNVA